MYRTPILLSAPASSQLMAISSGPLYSGLKLRQSTVFLTSALETGIYKINWLASEMKPSGTVTGFNSDLLFRG